MTVSKKLERLLRKNPEITIEQARKKVGNVSGSTFYKYKNKAAAEAAANNSGDQTTTLTQPTVIKQPSWTAYGQDAPKRSTQQKNELVTLEELDSTRKLVQSMGEEKLTGLIKKLSNNNFRLRIVDGE